MIHPVADHYYYNKRYTEAKPFYRLAFNFATFTRNRDLERLIEILIIEQDYTEARATLNKFLKQEADPVHYKKLLDLIINASGNR